MLVSIVTFEMTELYLHTLALNTAKASCFEFCAGYLRLNFRTFATNLVSEAPLGGDAFRENHYPINLEIDKIKVD